MVYFKLLYATLAVCALFFSKANGDIDLPLRGWAEAKWHNNDYVKGKPVKQLVIAHRGASAYLPEHTLEGASMAHAMNSDFIEPDIVLTKDGIPIVLHDLTLESTTDVSNIFPFRHREDGRYYAIDFSLEEIKMLQVNERRSDETGDNKYPSRFPSDAAIFRVPTLDELILLIHGLNKSRNKHIGIYPEIKEPGFHLAEGKDITLIVLKHLKKHGYSKRSDNIFLQCFDPRTLQRIKWDLHSELKLIQLIDEDGLYTRDGLDYKEMKTIAGLDTISEYAQGVGIWGDDLVVSNRYGYRPRKELVEHAHRRGLLVHVYTLRKDKLPSYANTWPEMISLFFGTLNVDGAFSDFPDEVKKQVVT